MIRRHSVFVIALLLPGWGRTLEGATYFVRVTATGAGDCSAWAHACTLQQAIDLAQGGTPDQIWVKSGTHASIAISDSVDIYGGFAGTETAVSQSNPTANQTIIDGNNALRGILIDQDAANVRVQGLVIRNGNAGGDFVGGGGAVLLEGTAVAFVNCDFEDNKAEFLGGAVAAWGVRADFVNCKFARNGRAPLQGQPSSTARPFGGGALFASIDCELTIVNCLFADNIAAEGGAVASGAWKGTVRNSTFVNNWAAYTDGGGLYDNSRVMPVHNCIFRGNWAARSGNHIFGFPQRTPAVVTYSNVEGGWTGTGNIDADPLFANPAAGDYTLTSSSPCKNTGSTGLLPLDVFDVDYDGNTSEAIPRDLRRCQRTFGGTVDMGAYEYSFCTGGGSGAQ